MRRLLTLAVCLASALSVAACNVSLFPYARGTQSPPPAVLSPARLAAAAVNDWGTGPAERFHGSFSASGIDLSVDVTLAFDSGQAGLGSGTANQVPFQYLSAGGSSYLKGQPFWQSYYGGEPTQQMLAKGYGEHFTVATGNNVALALGQLRNLAGAVETLSSQQQSVHRGAVRRIDGRRAVGLIKGDTTWWVTQRRPVTLVGLRTPTQGGLQSLDLTMKNSPAPVDLRGQLGTPVDPDDPSTLPARYQVVNVDQQDQSHCTNTACGFDVTVINRGGGAAGQGVVTVDTYADQTSTTVLASCTANIPTSLATNQTGVVSCGVSGPGWQAFAGGSFYVRAKVTSNPPYV